MTNATPQALKPLGRYFDYATFEKHFMSAVESLPPDTYTFSFLGASVENRSIYGLKLGHGKFRILAWSQMHGNESTTTRALLDLINSPDLFQILKNISLYIIPVLNPDGLQRWSRFNANGVDLNRDAVDLSQPESTILKDVVDFYEPDLALNLHGQRTFYGALGSVLPAQLSFLTPSGDTTKSIDDNRLRSMALINAMVYSFKPKFPSVIARYDDSYNSNCWGDYCQSIGIPTILFEAGHAGDDYSRNEVKDLILSSLKIVLEHSISIDSLDQAAIIAAYESIPAIERNYCDILIRNVPSVDGTREIAIMYHEQIIDGELCFIPKIFAINESSILYGHRIIDLNTHSNYMDDLEILDELTVLSESLQIGIFIK